MELGVILFSLRGVSGPDMALTTFGSALTLFLVFLFLSRFNYVKYGDPTPLGRPPLSLFISFVATLAFDGVALDFSFG
jgi:hypothetical protein